MDWLGDVVRPRPGAADREAGSADGGVSSGGTWRRDWEVETQDPVQPVAEAGRNLRLRRGRRRRAFAEEADRERDAGGGEDGDGGSPGHDYTPTGGALDVQSGGGGRSPAREEAS